MKLDLDGLRNLNKENRDLRAEMARLRKALGELHHESHAVAKAYSALVMCGPGKCDPSVQRLYDVLRSTLPLLSEEETHG